MRSGAKDLRASGAYPLDFGRKVCELHLQSIVPCLTQDFKGVLAGGSQSLGAKVTLAMHPHHSDRFWM